MLVASPVVGQFDVLPISDVRRVGAVQKTAIAGDVSVLAGIYEPNIFVFHGEVERDAAMRGQWCRELVNVKAEVVVVHNRSLSAGKLQFTDLDVLPWQRS